MLRKIKRNILKNKLKENGIKAKNISKHYQKYKNFIKAQKNRGEEKCQ